MQAIVVAVASVIGGYWAARGRVDHFLLEQLQAVPEIANKVRR